MADRLAIYNRALSRLGANTKLTSLSANSVLISKLNVAWDGIIDYCFENHLWSFATKTIKLQADTDVVPEFGYRYFFTLPYSFLGKVGLFIDEYCRCKLESYNREHLDLYCDYDTLYIRYIDIDLANDLSRWSHKFELYVAHVLAERACLDIKSDEGLKNTIRSEAAQYHLEAMNFDANEKQQRPRTYSRWMQARTTGNIWNSGIW